MSKDKLCHMAQIRPEARSHIKKRTAPHGAVDGPEAQEPRKMRRAAPRHKARGAGITPHVGRNCKG